MSPSASPQTTVESSMHSKRPLFTLLEDPTPRHRATFYSREEAICYATATLQAITQDLIPSGALMYGSSGDYQKTRRVIADANIARKALQIAFPEAVAGSTGAVDRRNADVEMAMMLRALADAEKIVSATADLLKEMGMDAFRGVEDGYARRGHVLNSAVPFLASVQKRFGQRIREIAEVYGEGAGA